MASAAYRSLYWRIALGFILCIAGVLVVQGIAFLWLMNRAATAVGSNLTAAVTKDVSRVLEAEGTIDLEAVRSRQVPGAPAVLLCRHDERTGRLRRRVEA